MPRFVTTGPSILQAPLFVLAFLWLTVALGRRIQRWLGVPAQDLAIEPTIAALGLGAGALQLVPFALGAVGRLSPWSLRIAIFVIALALAPELWAVAMALKETVAKRRLERNWVSLWAVALAPGLLAAGLLALAPAIDPDGLGYHLTVPKRWLASGSLSYLPTYPNSNMPMGVEMLFAIALTFAGDAAAKALHVFFGIVGAIGLYHAGRRLRGRVVGAAAVTLYLFGPLGVGGLLGWAYLEGITSFATIAAVLAWLVWFQEGDSGWLRTAFLLAGIGVSFKITAGLIPVTLVGLTVAAYLVDPTKRRPALTPKYSLSLIALCVLPVTPWLLRAGVVTGNPIFPMLARYIPSRDFSPELAAQWEYFNRYVNWAIVIGEHWSMPTRQIVLAVVAASATVGALILRSLLRSPMARVATLVLLGTVLVQIAAVGLYLRYWVPLASVLQLPVLAACVRVLDGRWQRGALVAATLLASVAQARRCLRTADDDVGGLVRTALGLETQESFLSRHLGLFSLYEQINLQSPADSTVLLTCYCGGFHVDRTTYCADIVQGSLRLAVWDEFRADLRRLHVNYVLAPRSLAEGGAPPPFDASGVGFMVRKEEYSAVGRLLSEHGRWLGSAADQGLYALDDAVVPPSQESHENLQSQQRGSLRGTR